MQTSGQLQAGSPPKSGGPAIVPATRYTPLPLIKVGKRRPQSLRDWFNQELKDGRKLAEYLRREKATGLRRRRVIANRLQNFEQNTKSDLRLRAVLPAREFFRLRQMDPNFFKDDTNLKNLIRDNPEIAPWRNK